MHICFRKPFFDTLTICYFRTPTHYLCFFRPAENTIKLGKNKQKKSWTDFQRNLGRIFNSKTPKSWTDFQLYIYIYIYIYFFFWFFLGATNLIRKNAPEFSQNFLSLAFAGPKESRKFPPNFPQNVPAKRVSSKRCSRKRCRQEQECVRNAAEMRQNGSCFIGERGTFQNAAKIARNTVGGEHLLDGTKKTAKLLQERRENKSMRSCNILILGAVCSCQSVCLTPSTYFGQCLTHSKQICVSNECLAESKDLTARGTGRQNQGLPCRQIGDFQAP